MRANTIEYKQIMDDNAGGYYDQHVYRSNSSLEYSRSSTSRRELSLITRGSTISRQL